MLDKALKSLNESEIEKRMRKYGLRSIAIFMIVFIAFLMILIYSNKRYIKNNVEVITRNLKSYIENQNDEKDRINDNIKQSLNNKYSFEYINDNVYAILRNFILKNENSKTAHIMFNDKSIYSLDKTGKLVLEKNSRLYIEIEKILEILTNKLSAYPLELENNVRLLGIIDLIFAKANYGISINGISPIINDKKEFNLIKARHPLIDKNKVVPI